MELILVRESVSLISEVFYQMQNSAEMLRESKDKLFTHTGEPICIVCSMDMNVIHNGQVATLPLLATQGKKPSLLGRNLLIDKYFPKHEST